VCHRTEPFAAVDYALQVCAKAIAKNVSVRTDKGSVDCIDGFLDQMKRESK
jgi:hypothetical protein